MLLSVFLRDQKGDHSLRPALGQEQDTGIPHGVQVQISAALLAIQPLANTPGQAAAEGPSTWTSASHIKHLDEFWAPGFSPVLAIVTFWGVNQRMED